MIKKLTIITVLVLALFTGFFLGADLSPSQECIEGKQFFLNYSMNILEDLETCYMLTGQLMEQFYYYDDGLWKLKPEFKQAQELMDLREEMENKMEDSKKGDMEI